MPTHWGMTVPRTTVWEHTQVAGQRLVEVVEHQRQHSPVERTQWDHREYDPRACKGVGMDGGMVYVRGEGWKELKAGVIGTIALGNLDPDTQPDEQCHRLRDMQYVAVVGDHQTFPRRCGPSRYPKAFRTPDAARLSPMVLPGFGVSPLIYSRSARRLWTGIMPKTTWLRLLLPASPKTRRLLVSGSNNWKCCCTKAKSGNSCWCCAALG